MRLFLECAMGASGDMLMSALYELLPDKENFRRQMEQLGLPGVAMEYSKSIKCGIKGTHISVKVGGAEEKSEDAEAYGDNGGHSHDSHGHTHNADSHDSHGHTHTHIDSHEHPHDENAGDAGMAHTAPRGRYGYNGMLELIGGLALPEDVIENALAVYNIIGEAEAAVHGVPVSNIHLHEIGSIDAAADIVGCCLLVSKLGLTEIIASPVHVGFGSVRCEHGILPVPAPATAEILKGIPIYSGSIKGELCTPTGAALLKHFVKSFGEMPPMIVAEIGCGMGTKDFEKANCLRAFLCEDETYDGGKHDTTYEISCNLDDMTPEAIGAVFSLLFENGALDVYTTPIMMKKNRPAVLLTCLCAAGKRDELALLMLKNTSTFGVRITTCHRDLLTRGAETVSTEYGDIRIKRAYGFGIRKLKPEYDDVLESAKKHGVPFASVYDAAVRAAGK